MENQVTKTDVVIIGAGPVGLFAVFECGMLGLKSHVIDSLDDIGGQCTALYPEKPIYDIPASPQILAGDLITNLEKQAAPFHPVYHLGQQVIAIAKKENGFLVSTSKNTHLETKVILIAAGAGAFGPNRPPLDNIEEFENKSVFYYVKDTSQFKNKNVLIAGGGDSAVDWTIHLSTIAKSITLIHRRDKFKAAPDNVAKLKQLSESGKIKIDIGWQLHGLQGKNGVLEKVELQDLDGATKTIECDCILPFFGLSHDLGPIKEWNLEIEGNRINVDHLTQMTNEKGIFAIGDICSYPEKLNLILTGFSEAAVAAHQARKIIFPGKEFHFEYSTTQGIPQK